MTGAGARRAARWAVLLTLATCAPVPQPAPEPAPSPAPATHLEARPGAALLALPSGGVAAADGVPAVTVEIAATYAQRQRGLGGRETLPDGRGMLFVYPESEERTFWMKDCLIALDIAFLDVDGGIREIATLPPGAGLTGNDIPSHTSRAPIRYVLEVRARWFDENGIRPGDVVDLRHVLRGIEPD